MKNWAIYIVIALAVVAYNAATQADRDGSGAIVGEGAVDAFNIRLGDCFDDSSTSFGDGSQQVNDLPGVPCAEPHDNEVYAVINLTLPEFPEGDTIGEVAFDTCMTKFDTFVGNDYDSSSLDILTLYPTRDSWNQLNDREVVCAVYDMNSAKLSGSAQGLAL